MNLFLKTTMCSLCAIVVFCFLIFETQAMSKRSLNSIYENPRVLIITGRFNEIEKQIQIFEKDKSALFDRHIAVLRQNANKALTAHQPLSNPDYPISNIKHYDEYALKDNDKKFMIYLIGKDGGLKQEWSNIIQFDEVSQIIDQMPMRQIEANRSILRKIMPLGNFYIAKAFPYLVPKCLI